MRQLLIDGFNDLHGVCGSTATFGSSTVNCLTDEETIFEDLELGGISEEIDGALQLLKDDFTVIPDAGDKFTFDGKEFRVARVQTDFADPILTVAYTFLQDIATNNKQGTASITIGASATATHEENTTTNATGSAGITISSSATASTHTVNSASASAAIAITATGSATTTSTTSASASAAIALSTVAYATLQSVTSSSGSAAIAISAIATATTSSITNATGSAAIAISASGVATTTSTTSASGSVAIAISASGTATTSSTTSATGSAAITVSATGSATTSSTTNATGSASIAISASGSATTYNQTSASGSAAIEISATGSATANYGNSYAVSCDGTDDYIDLNSNFSSVFNSDFSVAFWINLPEGQPTGSGHSATSNSNLFGLSNDGSAHRFFGLIGRGGQTEAGKLRVIYKAGGNQVHARTASAFFSSGATGWVHVVITVEEASNGIKMYKNGSAVSVDEVTNSMSSVTMSNFAGNVDMVFGASNRGGSVGANYEVDADFDEIAIFSTALSSSQVSTIYNSGDAYNLTGHSNLEGWWRMGDGTENGSGTSVEDLAGSNDATLVNGASFITNTP